MTHFWVTCGGDEVKKQKWIDSKGAQNEDGMLSRECIIGGTRCVHRELNSNATPSTWAMTFRWPKENGITWPKDYIKIDHVTESKLSPLNLKHFNRSQWALLPFTMKLTVTIFQNNSSKMTSALKIVKNQPNSKNLLKRLRKSFKSGF